jgi:3-methylcrotonyl-CoA carboxylase alpha subunit
MFESILIANRGEIACRIIGTAQRLGMRAIAVHSEADIGARHVRLADESHWIGPAPAPESYLRGDTIVQAALQAGANAIHPGYGFLSENADFAQACANAGLHFVGPSPEAIRAMGSKRVAKDLMQVAGVPVTPDYRGDDQSVKKFLEQAQVLGYPIMLKPALGGGGKGMRRVNVASDLPDALAAAQREAQAAFGDAEILAEKYIRSPRHIEVQVFGDNQGNVVHLMERDCTLQRRHQKVIEEAPAPFLSEAVRTSLRATAVQAARAVQYVGAGTVEFLVEGTGAFYFMEMNTRLQVEHPVTEMITGLDLVEWQIKVAAGEPLPLAQSDIRADGHAIEARVYAESPHAGFLPAPGRILGLTLPEGLDCRVDRGVDQYDEVSSFYDPMIAKIVVRGGDREAARRNLLGAVLAARVDGLETNLAFLAALLALSEFKAGTLDVQLVDRALDRLVAGDAAPGPEAVAAAALAWSRSLASGCVTSDPWHDVRGWQPNLPSRLMFYVESPDGSLPVVLNGVGPTQFSWANHTLLLDEVRVDGHVVAFLVADQRQKMIVVQGASDFHVITEVGVDRLKVGDPFAAVTDGAGSETTTVAPMPGKLTQVFVSVGQTVVAGEHLAIIEAMKMEHVLRAPRDSVVAQVSGALGDFVGEGTVIVAFEKVLG